MRVLKHFAQLAPVFVLMLIGGLIVASPFVVEGAPSPQGLPTPRPTVALTQPAKQGGGRGPVDSQIDLALVVDKAEASPGEQLRYQMQISNLLGKEATNVWLTCDLPDEVEIEKVTTTRGEVRYYGQRISVEIGRLQPGFESYFVTILTHIRQDVEPGTELIYRANLTSDQAGGGERSAETTVLGAALAATPETDSTSMLPTTGNGSTPWWLVLGFGTLIVVVALASMRERIHVSG